MGKRVFVIVASLFMAISICGCGESECIDGTRVCEGSLSRTCVEGHWREVECKDNAPICDEKFGCMKSSASCGNNVVESGEECDGSALNGKSCHELNSAWKGTLSCKSDCTIDFSGCTQLECTVDDHQCSGSVLQLCTENGWIDATDCAKTGLKCDPEKKGCAAVD